MLRAACFLMILCGCLAATTASAAPFNSPHGYTLSVPAGWHIEPHLAAGDDANVVLDQKVAVGGRMTTPILAIQFRAAGRQVVAANLGAINDGVLDAIRRHFPDLKVLSQIPSTLGGVHDLDCIFTATGTDGMPLRFHEMLIARRNLVFTFTSICPRQVYPKYASAYAQMLSSVHWKTL